MFRSKSNQEDPKENDQHPRTSRDDLGRLHRGLSRADPAPRSPDPKEAHHRRDIDRHRRHFHSQPPSTRRGRRRGDRRRRGAARFHRRRSGETGKLHAAGAPKPDLSTVEALKRALLNAQSIAYSASVSGDYLTKELVQRLGIADQVLPKSRRIEGGERVGAVIARGEAEIGFQQISELLPVPGIAHVTPLPPEVQKVSVFSAGIAASTGDAEAARAAIRFLASREAAAAIIKSGLEPAADR